MADKNPLHNYEALQFIKLQRENFPEGLLQARTFRLSLQKEFRDSMDPTLFLNNLLTVMQGPMVYFCCWIHPKGSAG